MVAAGGAELPDVLESEYQAGWLVVALDRLGGASQSLPTGWLIGVLAAVLTSTSLAGSRDTKKGCRLAVKHCEGERGHSKKWGLCGTHLALNTNIPL